MNLRIVTIFFCAFLSVVSVGDVCSAGPEQLLLNQINTWESRDRIDLAQLAIEKLFAISPENPDGLSMLAFLQLRQNDPAAAEQTLARLIKAAPDHHEIDNIRAMLRLAGPDKQRLQEIRLLAKSGRHAEAIRAYDALFPKGPPSPQLRYEYWQLVGETDEGWQRALAGMEKMTKQHPESLRYRLALIEHKLSRDPGNRELLDALFTFVENPRYKRQALATWRRAVFRLDEVPKSIPYYQEYLAYEPDDTGIRNILEQVEEDQREYARLLKDPAFRAKLKGLELLDTGNLVEAEKTFLFSLQSRPDDADAVGGMGIIRLRQGRHEEAQNYFQQALKLDSDNPSKWQSLIKTTRFWGLLAKAGKQMENKQLEQAELSINTALAMEQHPEALAMHAKLFILAGKMGQGRALYGKSLKQYPESSALLRGLLNSYLDTGEIDQARLVLDGLTDRQKHVVLADNYNRMQSLILKAEAERFIKKGELARAVDVLEQAREYTPDDAWLLFDLARIFRRQGQSPEKALGYFEEAAQRRPESDEIAHAHGLFLRSLDETDAALAVFRTIPRKQRSIGIQDSIDELAVERTSQFRIAYDFITRSADDGKSSLDTYQVPMQLRLAAPGNGHMFFHIEPVNLSAGSLDFTDRTQVSDLGQGLFCFPDCSAEDQEQDARGIILALGYEKKRLRLDLGTTPLGFEVEDVVGGISYGSNVDIFYWGIDISRRPMVGTLLTYAGTKDIRTGQVWGGVRANGVTFSLGHDVGDSFGFWSNTELHYLSGKNVADNNRFRLMAGAYWRFINEDDLQLSTGLNGGLWRHEKTLDEFTYGQGGYYSPKRYESLSIPVELTSRYNSRFSYRLRASVSYSRDYEDRMPYYPNDPGLQAEAEAIQGTTGIDPYFAGGSGDGFGYSLLAAVEYKLNNHLSLSANISTDQSDYYQPIRAFLLLSYSFDENRLKVPMVSRREQSYTDY